MVILNDNKSHFMVVFMGDLNHHDKNPPVYLLSITMKVSFSWRDVHIKRDASGAIPTTVAADLRCNKVMQHLLGGALEE